MVQEILCQSQQKRLSYLAKRHTNHPYFKPVHCSGSESIQSTNKITIKLWKLNKLAFEDIILSINHTTNQGKTAFHLVDNSITAEQPDGNCKIAWENSHRNIFQKQLHPISNLRKNLLTAPLKIYLLLQRNGSANWKV